MDEPYARTAGNLSRARRQRGRGEEGNRSLSASYDGVMEQLMGLPLPHGHILESSVRCAGISWGCFVRGLRSDNTPAVAMPAVEPDIGKPRSCQQALGLYTRVVLRVLGIELIKDD